MQWDVKYIWTFWTQRQHSGSVMLLYSFHESEPYVICACKSNVVTMSKYDIELQAVYYDY